MYIISLIGMEVGNSSIDVKFSAIVDSGTSFTSLADPMYTKLAESVSNVLDDEVEHLQIKYTRIKFEVVFLL